MARRLTDCVRAADTVRRIGGDEYVVLLDGIQQFEDAAMVTRKILTSLSAPYELAEATLQSIPSIGVAVYPENGDDADDLIRYADTAMYQAKRVRL